MIAQNKYLCLLPLYTFFLIFGVLVSSASAGTITFEAIAGSAKEADGRKIRLDGPFTAAASVDTDADGLKKSDRDPNNQACKDPNAVFMRVGMTDKCELPVKDAFIKAEVPDYTNGNVTAGGKAEYKRRQEKILGASYTKADIRATAKLVDPKKPGTGKTTSIVDIDPDGNFVSLDNDGVKNDVIIPFLVNLESSLPIFSDFNPETDTGLLSINMKVQSSFFGGTVYDIKASIGNTGIPLPIVTIASGWQIFPITNPNVFLEGEDLRLSTDFSSTGLTISQFEDAWTDYITADNGGGFGGSSPFGAWFVKSDIPDSELGEWTWEENIKGQVQVAVPESSSVPSLLALGILGTASTIMKKKLIFRSSKNV